MQWREASCVLCGKKIPIRLKGKLYKTMMCESECLAVDNSTDMRMLRQMSKVAREDKIKIST